MFELHVPNAKECLLKEVITPNSLYEWTRRQSNPSICLSLISFLLYQTKWEEKENLTFYGSLETSLSLLSRIENTNRNKIKGILKKLAKDGFCQVNFEKDRVRIRWNWVIKDIEPSKIEQNSNPSQLIIPEWVIAKIGWNSNKPEILITALVILLYERVYNPNYYGGISIPEGAISSIKRRFKKEQLKRAYNRLVELKVLKKEGKELIIPWLEGER